MTKSPHPVVFISYDEPNADANYAALKELVPDALRVHGVKGFDTAHKLAADRAREAFGIDVTHFFTVDGDNRLLPKEWVKLLKEIEAKGLPSKHSVFSWRAINLMNGLCYGNGGLKLWPTFWVDEMKTHEASEGETKVDFCWDNSYIQLTGIVSVTDVNGSAYQAWRAGFREGVKMSLNQGKPQTKFDLANQRTQLNVMRFVAWASLGRDLQYGYWSIYGALMGFAHVNDGLRGNEHEQIIDYDTLRAIFGDVADYEDHVQPSEIDRLRAICQRFGVSVPLYGPLQSKTCKWFMTQAHKQSQSFFEVETWTPPVSPIL